jgi:hypothetical protein
MQSPLSTMLEILEPGGAAGDRRRRPPPPFYARASGIDSGRQGKDRVKSRQKLVVLSLLAAALATVSVLVGPWIAAAYRGDMWVDTLGYEVYAIRSGQKRIRFNFFASSSGGEGQIQILSIADGDRVLLEAPAASTRKSTFHLSSERKLDEIEAILSLAALDPLPDRLMVKGIVEYRPKGSAMSGKAAFSILVNTRVERRNSIFDRIKLKLTNG